MWNKMRARHYSILILAAVVALETSAIAIDRFLSKPENTAFEVVGQFRNNAFIKHFQVAEAKTPPIPSNLAQLAMLPRPGFSSPKSAFSIARKTDNSGMQAQAMVKSTPVSAPEVKEPDRWIDYSVTKGDSLAGIAGIFGTSAESIKAVNKIDEKAGIKAGRKIRVPVASPKVIYSVKSGDTLSKISAKFGFPLQALIKTNNLKQDTLVVGQKMEIPLRIQGKAFEIAKLPAPAQNESAKVAPVGRMVEPTSSAEGSAPVPEMHRIDALLKGNSTGKAPSLEKVTSSGAPQKLVIVKTPVLQMAAVPTAKSEPVIVPGDRAKAGKADGLKSSEPVQIANVKKSLESASTRIVPEKPSISQKPPSFKVAAAGNSTGLDSKTPGVRDNEIRMVPHLVKSGENLATIARQYKTSITQIITNNSQLTRSALKVGQQVQVPVTKKYYRVLQVTSKHADVSSGLSMPVHGSMTDPYGWRMHPVYHRKLFHAGVDYAAPRGTPIMAAQAGTVIYAGWLQGYGKLVVIRHPNGFSTRYGHCSAIRVNRGQVVRKSQVIGLVGSTGTATGNHLHFEVRRNGTLVNPLVALSTR